MSELRKDIIGGRWVIIAAERSRRPDDFRPKNETRKVEAGKFCPFCPGNENKTPPEVFAIRKKGTLPDQSGWLVRVVPNKFPALVRGDAPALNRSENGLFFWMEGIGVHEVIIETPDHHREMADLTLAQIEKILETYRQRITEIQAEKQYRYLHLFKNKGPEAGASLAHPHSQLIATPIVPKRIQEELRSSKELKEKFGQCIFCHLIEEELKKGERVVYENEHFCVVTPFAPRFPFELRLYPLRHSAWFSEIKENEIKSLARTMKFLLGRLKEVLSDPPYNFYIHQGPNPNSARDCPDGLAEYYHWHLEIIPVLSRVAGFEWGTGFYINPISPEASAGFLRKEKQNL